MYQKACRSGIFTVCSFLFTLSCKNRENQGRVLDTAYAETAGLSSEEKKWFDSFPHIGLECVGSRTTFKLILLPDSQDMVGLNIKSLLLMPDEGTLLIPALTRLENSADGRGIDYKVDIKSIDKKHTFKAVKIEGQKTKADYLGEAVECE